MERKILRLAEKALTYVSSNGRPIDAARIACLFLGGPGSAVEEELAVYQNKDGGFGNGLEPDFLLPSSSPMATSVAFQIMGELNLPDNHSLVSSAIEYLWSTYDEAIPGWHGVPESVNDYPHAPWWHWSGEASPTEYWGNPTAELIGYIVRHTPWHRSRQAQKLVDTACEYLVGRADEMEPHELGCFLRFAEFLPETRLGELVEKLATLMKNAVSIDPAEWTSYTPQPIDFIWSVDSPLYEPYKTAIQNNIEFLLSGVSPEGVWFPTWSWGDTYPADWKRARIEWAGVLSVKHLKAIQIFNM